MPDHLYEVVSGPSRSHALLAKPDRFALTYRPKQPIRKYFGAIIGDAVNNLRESLDYWMNNAVVCVGPRKKVHFPFSEQRKDLETSPNYPPVEKAFPDAAKFIATKVQPSRDTNLHLWAATSLCNDNKHNDFLPIVTVADVKNWNAWAGPAGIGGYFNKFDADKPHELVATNAGPFTIQKKLSPACEIAFPKGAVFEDQPVIPTLTSMAEVVSQSLDALECFIQPYCK